MVKKREKRTAQTVLFSFDKEQKNQYYDFDFRLILFMARHSHWHNIQLKKGKADAKKANVFAKITKNITMAVKEGGSDSLFNFKLRMAVDMAKAISVPKDNIDRAIARGLGSGGEIALEEVIYEGFGPGGIAFLVLCVTDNRNRTVANIKMIVSKNGGTVGAAGSVMWMFEKKGVVSFLKSAFSSDQETFELIMIEAGAEDFFSSEEGIQIICDGKNLKKILDMAEKHGWRPDHFGIEYLAKDEVQITDPDVQKQMEQFIDVLEDNEDVDAIYTNQA
jgi:YebC/PmpR family DNA-binding regulatory protein